MGGQTAEEVKKEPAETALVLLSGGIDSTTCLYIAVKEFNGHQNVKAISVNYGQRHHKEIQIARSICDRIGVHHAVVSAPELPESMLTSIDEEIPSVSYDDLPEGVSPTYVPFRNGLLLSYAAGIAHASGASTIYFGAHAEDSHNWAYPDCTPEFIGSMANAIYIGTYHKVRLKTPLEWLGKADIIRIGEALGVPYDLTWSCYAGGELHCGTCPTCRARHQGFIDSRYPDPTKYEVDPDLP